MLKRYNLRQSSLNDKGESLIHNKLQTYFPQDPTRNYNPSPIKIVTEEYTTTFKYSQQARFCLGVTKMRLLNGAIKGRKLKVFDYTSKRLVTIKNYNNKIQDKIKRVKFLGSETNSPWVEVNQPIANNDVYKGYSILKIPKLG